MRTLEEEVINAYSHLISAIVSLVVCFIYLDRIESDVHKLQFAILSLASSWTFFSSFLYHNTVEQKKKARNLVLDRVGIYLMITATGLSFSLGSMEDFNKILFCSCILVSSSLLIIKYCAKKNENELFSIISYLVFAVICILPITGAFNKNFLVNDSTLEILTLSLTCYAAGVIFYTIDSKKWAHTIWHLLVVIAYSLCLATLLTTFTVV